MDLRTRYLRAQDDPTARGVCLAQDRVTGATCMLKFVSAGAEHAGALQREGSLLADLDHPRLVSLTDRFVRASGFDGLPVTGLATRWIDGPGLREAAAALPVPGRVALFGGLLDAVAYLHRRGLLHLDLKPENVVVGEDGEPVLLDLGSARPTHAAPGEAGGTLGYAAPEVLQGEAPTAAADVYGLGAVLYEILAGRPPYGKVPPEATRRAMLAEDAPSLRVVAPDVPRALARVVDELLIRDPGRRVGSVGEIRDRLAAAGFPVALTAHGSPTMVGREFELDALREAVNGDEAGVIAVMGSVGSGRTRLVRRALAETTRPTVALDRVPGVAEAVYRLLSSVDARIPPRRAGWWKAWTAPVGGLASTVVFLGRRAATDPLDVEELDALAPQLQRAGVLVLWAAEEPPKGARCIAVAPLSSTEMERVAEDLGAVNAIALVEAAQGSPGLLLEGLLLAPERVQALAPELASTHRGLAKLPMPLPPTVLSRIDATVRLDLPHLVAAGLARWEPGGGLVVIGAAHGAVPDRFRGMVSAAVRDPRVSPTWAMVAAARIGEVEVARELFDRHGDRLAPDARIEVLESLVAAGDRGLRLPLGETLLARQRYDRAAEVLDVAEPSGDEVAMRARALRRARRMSEAEACLAALLSTGEHAGARCEQARLHVLAGRLDAAAAALELAGAVDPEHRWIIGGRIALETARTRAGGSADGLLKALDEVAPQTSAAALMNAGAALLSLRKLDAAREAYRKGVSSADDDGDRWNGTVARSALGRCLVHMNRTAEARQVYGEALAMAYAHGDHIVVMRICYALCALERQSDRLASAERYLAWFERAAARVEEPEATLRAAFLRAGIARDRGQPEDVIRVLEPISSKDREVMTSRAEYLAAAELALGRPEATLQRLDLHPEISADREVNLLRGRAHLAIARAHLSRVAAAIPEDEPDIRTRRDTGEALLAIAGEDLEPESFTRRRQQLGRAASLLRGPAAARAADLRERLHDGPSTSLESLAQLAETAHDPHLFPGALARLVGDALGAHRVVIVLRIPGLGQRVTWRDLSSGIEAAGIVSDVTQRIRTPADVWLAEDAFSDPAVRAASSTVRDFGIKSVVAVAIPHGDRVIGALYADDIVRVGRFGPREVEVLQRLARAVGRMVSLLPGVAESGEDPFAEPEDVHGVLLSGPTQIRAVRGTVELLRGQRESNLLVSGPTGAGKTWFARRIATEILGAQGLIELVLRRTDADKMVAQLSGTRRGDFSGAIDGMGVIEKAIRERKVLFLDEIQSLDDEGQQAMLPLLELPIRRFGGFLSEARKLNGPLHVIVGTNVDVSESAWRRHFRDDLWWRMAQHHVHLPPLAERGPEVVFRYLERMLAQHGAGAPDDVFELAALHTVTRHDWPGNLRMLEAFAQKAATLRATARRPLDVTDLERIGLGRETPLRRVGLDDLTSQAVLRALQMTGWNQKDAAPLLGISRFRLLRLLKTYRLLDEVRRRRGDDEAPSGSTKKRPPKR